MGLDGFSMSNLGLPRELTSAQLANQAEQLANRREPKIKDIGELAEENGVKRKEDEGNEGGAQGQLANSFFAEGDEEDENDQNFKKYSSILLEESFEGKDPKDYSVRINPRSGFVELYSKKERRVIETISADDLMEVISKLNSASGVFVNKKI